VTHRHVTTAILVLIVMSQGTHRAHRSLELATASASFVTECADTTGATSGDGGFTGHAARRCDEGAPKENRFHRNGSSAPPTKTVICGPRQLSTHLRTNADPVCRQVQDTCAVPLATQLSPDSSFTTTATLQRNRDGNWTLVGDDCEAKNAAPQVTALLVMQQVRRLVPHPKIGVAPPGGATLVNVQTLLWADTPADQPLGTVTLLGHRVALRVHVERVDWDFGDGQSDTTDGPKPKYDPADDCHTVTCPGYWGHVYVATGPMTIAASITWSGRYRIDGGAWQDIPDTVTGPTATAALTVKQARGVLVPNPGEH
jgi:hypothetical protein